MREVILLKRNKYQRKTVQLQT